MHSAAIRAHSTSRIFSNRPTNTSTSALPGSAINAYDTNNKVNTLTSNMTASIPVLNLPDTTTTINTKNKNNNNKNNNMDRKNKEESIAT